MRKSPRSSPSRPNQAKTAPRPDLVGFDHQGRERLLVEAKFWAGLTDNQPQGYLDRLTDNGGATALLFVAPRARLETLWAELCRLTGCEPGPAAGDPRSAAIAGDKSLILTSWPALLNSLSAQAALQGDRLVEADISQLRALCERQDEAAFLPLRPGEFAPAFPRRLLQLNRLVDDATELAVNSEIASTEGLSRTPQAWGYGRYLVLGRASTDVWAGAWFGVHQQFWASSRETPLWLVFSAWAGTVPMEVLRQRLGEDIWAGTENAIPVELPTLVERDAVLRAVVERLSHIATAVAAEQ